MYFSAFTNVNQIDSLPLENKNLTIREHRLYQADWLLRYYNFTVEEITDDFLDLEIDPKTKWAIKNFSFFPMEITKVNYEELLRIPGIGLTSAKKIIEARKTSILNLQALKNMKIQLKKVLNFITINGRYYGVKTDNFKKLTKSLKENYFQPSLFEGDL